jgi:para-nitrobenzyl esterase
MIKAQTPERATQGTKAFLQILGVAPENIAELRTMPIQKIADALNNLPPEGAVNFGPVMDGRSLPRHPFDPDAPAISAQVPLMVGTIKDETTLLIGARDPSAFAITWEDLPKRLQPFTGTLDPAQFIDGLRKLQPQAKPSDVFFTITTARNFRNGAIRQAELKSQAGAAPPFLYELDWETPVEGGKWKAPHALEIGMVFDNVAKSGSMSGTSPEAQKVADQMSAAWLAFAKSGNPGWPAYDTKRRATMVFNATSKVVDDHNGQERALLGKLPPRTP